MQHLDTSMAKPSHAKYASSDFLSPPPLLTTDSHEPCEQDRHDLKRDI
jgi:hypothetical protein